MSKLFKTNDLELSERVSRIKTNHQLACGAFRNGYLHDMLHYLAEIENEARHAQWRILTITQDHGKRKLEAQRAVGETQQE